MSTVSCQMSQLILWSNNQYLAVRLINFISGTKLKKKTNIFGSGTAIWTTRQRL